MNHAVRVGVWVGIEEYRIYDAKHGRGRSNSQRQRNDCCQGEPGAFRKLPKSVTKVLKQALHSPPPDKVPAFGWPRCAPDKCLGGKGLQKEIGLSEWQGCSVAESVFAGGQSGPFAGQCNNCSLLPKASRPWKKAAHILSERCTRSRPA